MSVSKNLTPKLWIPILLGVVACLLVVGPNALNPAVLDLAQGVDPFKDYVGWMFFRNSPWTFPIGLNPTYGLEFSNSIVFSDSIPLLAFLFKAIRFILPETFQYLGIWTLICFVLQAYFAWLILGLITTNKAVQFFACSILLFSPPMLWRVNQHTALVAHFMILAAFYLIFSPERTSKVFNKGSFWALLLGAAVLTHFSLFVMIATIWGANLVDQAVFSNAGRLSKIKEGTLQILWISPFVAFLMWQAGYFSMGSSSGSLGGYGFFRMNLLSPLDPKGWSYILRTLPLPSDWGEGYMYFGLGLLFLWPFALYRFIKEGSLRTLFGKKIYKNLFLILALLCMALFAITNHIAIGRKEFGFGISDSVYGIASIFRASGRFFWPMFYALNLACLYIVIRAYSNRSALILLGVACCLQVVDTSAGWRAMHQHISDPTKNIPHELSLKSPFWQEAAKHYKEIQLVSPQDKGRGWEQIALYAAKYHLATNAVFLARVDREKLGKAQKTFLNNLNNSFWKTNTLYVLQPDLIIPAYLHSNAKTDLLINLDGFAVLAPNWKQCSDCLPMVENLRNELDRIVKQGKPNELIQFGKGNLGTSLIVGVWGDWSWPEGWGVWSNGDQAKMILPIPEGGKAKQLKLNVRAFVTNLHPKQEVEVLIDKMPPQSTILTNSETNTWIINLPPYTEASKYIELQFRFKSPASPKDVGGVPGDDRRLGIGLITAAFQ
jgi:Family of unknown function (DUF6311)